MEKYLLRLLVISSTVALSSASDVDSLNLKYMYEGAQEIEMLNRSMEAGMKQHNQPVQPISTETIERTIDNTPVLTFQDMEDRYYLERLIDNPKNTKVKVTIHGDMVKIETTTTKREHITTVHGMGESVSTSSTVEEISIPFDADSSKMKKEYKNGILKITFLKKRKG
jgi:HSP20 family molecular chaperone IbpA